MLRRQPGFTAVAVFALALGIGATTAIFSVVDAVLWRPLPFPHADRVMSLAEQRPRESRWFGPIAPADYFDWRRDNHSFSAIAAYTITSPSSAYNLTGDGEPERVRPLEVTPAFLAVIGIAPALGRDFRFEEETVGRHRVVLLSDALWRRRFGADPSVAGRTVAFDGRTFEIVGVLPAQFWWPTHPDVVVPLALDDHDRTLRGAHFLEAVGRLRDGVSPDGAREDLRIIGARLSQEFPAENADHAPNLRPLRDALVGDVQATMLVVLGAVGFVLLIACANVATLLLARAAARQREVSIRTAVGASRGRLVQQMLTESLVIAAAGGAAGVLLAAWSLSAARALLPARFAGLPGIDHLGIDVRVLLAAATVSLVTGLIFGMLPALAASDQRLRISLNEEPRGGTGSIRARRLRSCLVVAELALSLILLAGAALLVVSFDNLINVSPGFQPAQLVTARVTPPGRVTRARANGRVLRRRARAPGRRSRRSTSGCDDVGAVRRRGLASRPDDRTTYHRVAVSRSRPHAPGLVRILSGNGDSARAGEGVQQPRRGDVGKRRDHQRGGGAPLLAERGSDGPADQHRRHRRLARDRRGRRRHPSRGSRRRRRSGRLPAAAAAVRLARRRVRADGDARRPHER
jgi:putative ABC transport system permease protein